MRYAFFVSIPLLVRLRGFYFDVDEDGELSFNSIIGAIKRGKSEKTDVMNAVVSIPLLVRLRDDIQD